MSTAAPSPQPTGATPGAIEASRRYTSATEDLAETAGLINAAHGRLVDLTIVTMAEGHHIGPGLHTIGQYLCWQLGISTSVANALVRIAKRVDELPTLVAALRDGQISLDQAEVVARYVPTAYDASATELAKAATVKQLKALLPHFRDPDKATTTPSLGIGITRHDDGTATVSGRLSAQTADVVEQALDAMREDLYRQRKADAKAAETRGEDPGAVEPPTSDETVLALAEGALRAGQASHPSSERYTVNYHLTQGPDGQLRLTDDRGRPIEDHRRQQILCEHRFEAVFHDANGVPLSVGRLTRAINRKLRRAILFRHRHTCAVDGCDRSYGLEIHHIWHWEHGGPTATWNLIPLCRHHHTAHHQGLLHIQGNADLPAGVPGALQIGRPERPVCEQRLAPKPVPGPEATRTLQRLRAELDQRSRARRPHRPTTRPAPWPVASTPTGERIDRRCFHLQAAPPPSPPLRT